MKSFFFLSCCPTTTDSRLMKSGPCCSKKMNVDSVQGGFSGPGLGPALWRGFGLRSHQAAVWLTWGRVIRNRIAAPEGRTEEQREAGLPIQEGMPMWPSTHPRLGLWLLPGPWAAARGREGFGFCLRIKNQDCNKAYDLYAFKDDRVCLLDC